jgi:hypothetical protein
MYEVDGIQSFGRDILLKRRHRIWFMYGEPVVSIVLVVGAYALLAAAYGAAIGAGAMGSLWVAGRLLGL